jgi:hypothetical protein
MNAPTTKTCRCKCQHDARITRLWKATRDAHRQTDEGYDPVNGRPRSPCVDEHTGREQDGGDEGEAESRFWAFPGDVFPCGRLSTRVGNARR